MVLSISVVAQDTLTAQQAVFEALKNNYQVQIAELQNEIAEKNNTWSEAGLFPTVQLNAVISNTIQDNTNNPFTFTPGIILSQNFNPQLTANWNLFAGCGVKINKQRLEQLESQSNGNGLLIVENTAVDVLKAYYSAVVQKKKLESIKQMLKFSRKKVRYYDLKEKYANASSLESLQFKNQYLSDSSNFLLQEINLKNAYRNLMILLNRPEEDVANGNFPILSDQLFLPIKNESFESLSSEMKSNNQNLKNQYINLELQRTATEYQKSFLYPVVSLQMGVNPGWGEIRDLKNDDMQVSTQTLSYFANVNVRYTIFNNWKTKRASEVAEIQTEIAELNVADFEKQLNSSLKSMKELYDARSIIVNVSDENLIYAEKSWEMGQLQYNNGSLNSIDISQLRLAYLNSFNTHYDNLYARIDAFLELHRMTGQLRMEYASAGGE